MRPWSTKTPQKTGPGMHHEHGTPLSGWKIQNRNANPEMEKNTHVFVWFLFRHLGFADYSMVFLKMDTILRRDSFWKISDFQMLPTHGRAVIHSELWYHILTYMDGVSWVAWHPAPIQKLTSPWKFDGLKTTFLLESRFREGFLRKKSIPSPRIIWQDWSFKFPPLELTLNTLILAVMSCHFFGQWHQLWINFNRFLIRRLSELPNNKSDEKNSLRPPRRNKHVYTWLSSIIMSCTIDTFLERTVNHFRDLLFVLWMTIAPQVPTSECFFFQNLDPVACAQFESCHLGPF